MPLAIAANDFDYSNITVRYDWTIGKMRHLIAALDGAEVAIVVDKHDGYTMIGHLVETFEDDIGSGPQVTVETRRLHGHVDRFTYRLLEIGTIIELSEDAEAKWVALESYRDETERAIEHARHQHPDWGPGVWTGVPHDDCVLVTYESRPDPPSMTEQVPLFAIPAERDG